MSTEDFETIGLTVIGFNVTKCRETNNRRFRSSFGVSAKVCSLCWDLLSLENNTITIDYNYLLMALHFLKCYDTESNNAGLFHVHEQTYRKYLWMYVGFLADMNMVNPYAYFHTVFLFTITD